MSDMCLQIVLMLPCISLSPIQRATELCTCIKYLFIFSSPPKTFNLLIKAERNCYIRSSAWGSSSVYICLYTKVNTLKGLETIY